MSNPTDDHVLKNGKKVELNTYNRETLKTELKNIEHLMVLMPTYHSKANGYNIRRPAMVAEEYEVPFTNNEEPRRVRRQATLVSSSIKPTRVRRTAKIIDKEDN